VRGRAERGACLILRNATQVVLHRQVVFTIPKRLRIFLRYDRKLLGELAACAWRALRLYFEVSFDGAELTPGAVGFLQTAGELLNFHPHVHILLTDGGFCPDGCFHHLPRLHSRHLERLFQADADSWGLSYSLLTTHPNRPVESGPTRLFTQLEGLQAPCTGAPSLATEKGIPIRKLLEAIAEPLVTTMPVLTEAFHMLSPESRGADALREFVRSGGVSVWFMDSPTLERAFELMQRYADRVYSEVIAVACQALPADHFFIGMFLVSHGRDLTRLGRYFESEAALLEGQTVLETVLGQGHRSTLSAVQALVHHYNQRGKEDEETSWQARLDARASAGGQE